MGNDIRYDDYFFAPVKTGICHYGSTLGTAIVRDTYYPITTMYKEAIIRSLQVTTSADLTGASVKVVLRKSGVVAITAIFADKTIATAQADSALTAGTMFTAPFKLNKFTLGDIAANVPAIGAALTDFNVMDLAFQITGADVPSTLLVSFVYEMAYKA